MAARYDVLGRTYSVTRRADPRIATAIASALGDAGTVVNVGAGTGSYEPPTTVLAVEPSAVMVAQRPPGSAAVVRGAAEALPLADGAVDAALAVFTVHHWSDLARGLREFTRVARKRVVVLTWDPARIADYWLLTEYFPEIGRADRSAAVPLPRLLDLLPGARVSPVPVPHDCTDGFGAAFWRRPEAYLDPAVRAGMSMFARHADPAGLEPGLGRLAADVRSRRWHDEHRALLDLESFDVGYVLVTAEL
ncbi:MAG TPA: class I SAM-dependent methyltransferase [Jatrophihabitans sp.]|jgi:SAM-dependent methyltransferase|uniref:class I SAM-dependent methyltransferase n=1 Tax=Jatrophihabitans sp. TaxID=1932789 RepID=UPI002DFF0B08|nr:class I SAM-dependent methyltransferase [Jatrophihabitans sp.]